jgi:hypothetical protein
MGPGTRLSLAPVILSIMGFRDVESTNFLFLVRATAATIALSAVAPATIASPTPSTTIPSSTSAETQILRLERGLRAHAAERSGDIRGSGRWRQGNVVWESLHMLDVQLAL